MNQLENKKKDIDRMINRMINQSRDFTWYACFNYGETRYFTTGEKTTEFTYDYDYFNFVKSTKILISIRELLKINHNENVFILIRSMFESYLSARYFQENDKLVDDFIFNPTMIAFAHYNISSNGMIKDRDEKVVGELKNPSKFKMGDDKRYYNDFYAFLCNFTHANYGMRACYMDKSQYNINKENYPILSRLFALFVFTKLFESIVTVDGEDFPNIQKKKTCYKLVTESLLLQKSIFDDAIKAYEDKSDESTRFFNKRIKEMLKSMKKSLKEELGSVSKEKLNVD